MSDLELTEHPKPAAEPTSQMATLLGLRNKIVDRQKLELVIPRWEPDARIVVSYRLLENDSYTKSMRQALEAKDSEIAQASLDANSDLLIRCCTGIKATGGITAEWTGFGPELADALGLTGDDREARKVVQTLFVSEGDLLAHARRVVEWSGYANQEVEEAFSGE